MSEKFTKLIKNPIVINLLAMVVVSLALVVGVLFWLDNYTRHNEAVVVPDVKGLTVEKAEEFLKSSGLRYSVIDSVFSKTVAPGSIVELLPTAGSKVKEGRIVFLTVNALTSEMAALPEITDLSFRQAYALLKACGFTTIEIVYVAGQYKDLAIGVQVNGRELSPGEHVPLSARLELLVSGGNNDNSLEEDSLYLEEGEVAPEKDVVGSEDEKWF